MTYGYLYEGAANHSTLFITLLFYPEVNYLCLIFWFFIKSNFLIFIISHSCQTTYLIYFVISFFFLRVRVRHGRTYIVVFGFLYNQSLLPITLECLSRKAERTHSDQVVDDILCIRVSIEKYPHCVYHLCVDKVRGTLIMLFN